MDDLEIEIDSSISRRRQLQLNSANYLASHSMNTNIKIGRTQLGRPFIPKSKTSISISHTRNWMSVILNDVNPVAIDIELVDRKVGKVIKKFTTGAELNQVQALFNSNPEIFIWCCKECLFKILPFEGIHFREQLLFEKSIESKPSDPIKTLWRVDHEQFKGHYIINSFIFESLLISYIDENGKLFTE